MWDDLKRLLLNVPVLGTGYKEWKRNRTIAAEREAQYQAWLEHPLARATVERLESYRDRHRGQRCFVIGNGPSLKSMDLSPLEHEITFGANRIYLLFEELGFTTTYFCSSNPNVVEQFAEDIQALPIPKFLTWDAVNLLDPDDQTMFIRYVHEERFHPSPLRGLWYGATVTYVSLQLAYFMGFETVYLIGVDHSFKDTGPAHKLVTSTGDDPNHFHPDYFGKGVKWQLPDLDTSEQAYLCARQYYEAHDRQILDATVGGKLQIFPKVDYASLFDD